VEGRTARRRTDAHAVGHRAIRVHRCRMATLALPLVRAAVRRSGVDAQEDTIHVEWVTPGRCTSPLLPKWQLAHRHATPRHCTARRWAVILLDGGARVTQSIARCSGEHRRYVEMRREGAGASRAATVWLAADPPSPLSIRVDNREIRERTESME
jgi:hypothetical protein